MIEIVSFSALSEKKKETKDTRSTHLTAVLIYRSSLPKSHFKVVFKIISSLNSNQFWKIKMKAIGIFCRIGLARIKTWMQVIHKLFGI